MGDSKHLPRFDPDWLGAFADYSRAVSESFQVAPELPACLILGAVSVATLGKYAVKVNSDWIEPTQLFVCVVAGSSERKSPTIRRVFAPIYDYERKMNDEKRIAVEAAKMRLKALDKRESAAVQKNDVPAMLEIARERQSVQREARTVTLTVSDATPEVIAPIMRDNDGCISCVSDEGGVFANISGRYAKGVANADIFLQGYSSEPVKVHRVGREPVVIPRACMSMVQCIQPPIAREILENPALNGCGLVARFIWCLPEELAGHRNIHPECVPERLERAYSERIEALLSIPRPDKPDVLTMSDAALKLFNESREKTEKRLLDDLGGELKECGWSGKHDGRVLRIAATLALIDGCSSIEREHICRGINIGNWMIAHAKQLICDNSSTVEAQTEQYKSAIRRKGWKVFALRDMQRAAPRRGGKYPKADEVIMILDALVEDGSIAELDADEGQKRWQVLNLD